MDCVVLKAACATFSPLISLTPQGAESTSHCLRSLQRFACDVVDHRVILKSIRPALVATHPGADLLAADIVLNSFRARPKAIIKHGNECRHGIAVV
jgi:hypothetical protein